DGTVIAASYSSGYGYYIMIDHGGGIVTLYAHSSKLIAKKGDKVKRGETIALVGSTGMSTGPHIHFEVRVNGSYKDPLNYVTPGRY
ncbi:MAG: M23 family metallopeptidase, partial [Firmicutes bacterium]|nr:M23 family metallopeptidase [Bacillota bacterium]